MVKLTIDGKLIEAKEGSTILEAAKSAGIYIPTLCYYKEVNQIGACRVCLVEIEGDERLSASCNTYVEEGMVVKTNSPRVRQARKVNVELILSQHNVNCTSCVRSGNCALQSVANDLNILDVPYEKKTAKSNWDMTAPLIRDASKCIKCYRCINVCENIQGLGVWDINGTGTRTKVALSRAEAIRDMNCTFCGQCITHCPTGALRERDDTDTVFAAIDNPDLITVLQMAPAVRTAWAANLGLTPEEATEKRMVAAFRALGVDYVFDTNFSADLTIMEEGSEFIERMTHPGEYKMPMFTSCCPGWVRFMKLEYPEYVNNLSTAKSPQQMFGAVTKSYFAKKIGVDPSKIYCISVMPCTAKKYEYDVPEVNDAVEGLKDVDMVITAREISRMIKAAHINVKELPEEEFDSPLGSGTGAAVIFGATGGVMEAALRSAYFLITGENPDADAFKAVRGPEPWREVSVEIKGIPVRAAVTSGLANTRKLMEAVISGEKEYDFIEIMACPGGCSGGGGQPISDGNELAFERGQILYKLDANNPLRFSHENPDVLKLYEEYMEKPLSHMSHKLLHTKQENWTL